MGSERGRDENEYGVDRKEIRFTVSVPCRSSDAADVTSLPHVQTKSQHRERPDQDRQFGARSPILWITLYVYARNNAPERLHRLFGLNACAKKRSQVRVYAEIAIAAIGCLRKGPLASPLCGCRSYGRDTNRIQSTGGWP